MDSRELRIGAWLYSNLTKVNFQCTAKDILAIHKDPSVVESIPLTEEILVKCGAKIVKPRSGIQKSFMLGSIRINLSNSGNFYYKKNVYNAVHEIQNLYYCIEKEELTINLYGSGL